VQDCFAVRRCRREEFGQVAEIVDLCFRWPGGAAGNFRAARPHLCTPARIADHWVCESRGRILGVVGVYPYDVRLAGVIFRMAGIGMVGTHPDHRGRGVMTAILEGAVRWLDDDGFDASWLAGDRMRYSRFGWTPAGRELRFVTSPRYLPEPAAARAVRELDVEGDLDRIVRHLDGLPGAVLMMRDELLMRLHGLHVRGWVKGDSFLMTDLTGEHVLLADGDPADIASLIAWQEAALRNEGRQLAAIETSTEGSALLRACRACCRSVSLHHCCSFRIGPLRRFLGKVGAMLAGRLPDGRGELRIANSDTGESAVLVVADGRADVRPGEARDPMAMSATELAEFFFGMLPVSDSTDYLAPDGPLRHMLPLSVHLPRVLREAV